MLALVEGEPQLLTLKKFLEVFVEFRVETITRRTNYLLQKAQERDHLLQGLLIALQDIESVIRIIRGAADTPTAKASLIEHFGLSEVQTDAILQMQLRRLTALEAEKIEAEHQDLLAKISDYQDILARRERIEQIIQTELTQIKEKYATPRRTVIESAEGEIVDLDLIANEQAIILVTEQGYIKRMPVNTFGSQNRATRGKSATKMKEDDEIEHFISCCDHDHLLFFSDRGVVYALNAYQVPIGSRTARGTPLLQMLPISQEEKITTVLAVREFTEEDYLIMLTRQGNIKKTSLSAFSNIRTNGLIAISLADEDQLRWVRLAKESDSIIIGSRKGMAIHFRASHEQLRPLGRATRGVKAMKLKPDDELISMDILPAQVIAEMKEESSEEEETPQEFTQPETLWILAITKGGYGKRVPITQFRLQNRAGKGLSAMKFRKQDCLAALKVVHEGEELMLVTNRGIIIRQGSDAIPRQSRQATGVRVQRLDEDDAIAAVALVPPAEEEEEEGEAN
jgi:DNA gyrase subunit A